MQVEKQNALCITYFFATLYIYIRGDKMCGNLSCLSLYINTSTDASEAPCSKQNVQGNNVFVQHGKEELRRKNLVLKKILFVECICFHGLTSMCAQLITQSREFSTKPPVRE